MGRTAPVRVGDGDGISRPYKDIWKSERLAYRAMENTDQEKAWYRAIMDDPVIAAQASGGLLRPVPPEEHNTAFEDSRKGMLSVVICLRPNEEAKHQAVQVGSAPADAADGGSGGDGKVQKDPPPTPVGYVALDVHPEMTHHRSCTLAIIVAPAFQNRGYGTEAIEWALDWAFRYGNAHAVRLGVFSYNVGAVRLYERLGFVREGCRREAVWFDRAWHDSLLYGMLESEWETRKGPAASSR